MLRIAITQTKNAYADMPAHVDELPRLADSLEAIRQANLDHHAMLIRHAAELGAKMIGLGELFPAPYFALTQLAFWRGLAEDARTGPSVTFLAELARAVDVAIVAPIYEIDGDKRFNTAVVIDHRGEVLGSYRKTHIPDGTNERATFSERFYYGPSDGGAFVDPEANISSNPHFPVFRCREAMVGVAICYDRHFDGVIRTLAQQGAQLVFSPAVTFGDKSERMWEHEFATDAVRHNVYVAGSNRKGSEPPWNVAYFGRSHVVGPCGPLANVSDHPELVVVDVDLELLSRDDPAGWNLQRDRRPDIYWPQK